MNRRKKRIIGALSLVLVALLVYLTFFYIFFKIPKDSGVSELEYCIPQSINLDADGEYVPPSELVCINGTWIPEDNPPKGTEQTYCMDDSLLIDQEFTGTTWDVNKTVLGGDQYCENGTIYNITVNCGNAVCDEGEDIINCPIDCGSFRDWSAYRDKISQQAWLDTYLESEYQMNYENSVIQDAVATIKVQYPDAMDSPYMWQKRANEWLNDNMEYVLGGVITCGEAASQSLSRGTGNCIDYSIIYCSLLRAEGIPCKQIEGCVTNWDSFQCIPFRPETWDYDLVGQVKGHSWVEMYIGSRWLQADPTIGVGAARSCTGYKKLGETDGNNICYISDEKEKDYCRYF